MTSTIRGIYLPLTALLLLAGCATAPVREEIPPFRQGVATVRQQTVSTLNQVNAFTREQQIERAVGQPTLSEESFLEALDPADIARWDRAFAEIDLYAAKLERLLNPGLRTNVESEIVELGEKFNGLGEEQIPAGLTAGFTRLGGLLIQFKAGSDALAAMQSADPAVGEVFTAMADAIGQDNESGIRGTVWTSRTNILGTIATKEFLAASGENSRRSAVHHYVEALDERAAHDQLLTSLRFSLITLGNTHHQLAQGSPVSAAALIGIVQDEYQAYREQLDAMRKRRAADPMTGDDP